MVIYCRLGLVRNLLAFQYHLQPLLPSAGRCAELFNGVLGVAFGPSRIERRTSLARMFAEVDDKFGDEHGKIGLNLGCQQIAMAKLAQQARTDPKVQAVAPSPASDGGFRPRSRYS